MDFVERRVILVNSQKGQRFCVRLQGVPHSISVSVALARRPEIGFGDSLLQQIEGRAAKTFEAPGCIRMNCPNRKISEWVEESHLEFAWRDTGKLTGVVHQHFEEFP